MISQAVQKLYNAVQLIIIQRCDVRSIIHHACSGTTAAECNLTFHTGRRNYMAENFVYYLWLVKDPVCAVRFKFSIMAMRKSVNNPVCVVYCATAKCY